MTFKIVVLSLLLCLLFTLFGIGVVRRETHGVSAKEILTRGGE